MSVPDLEPYRWPAWTLHGEPVRLPHPPSGLVFHGLPTGRRGIGGDREPWVEVDFLAGADGSPWRAEVLVGDLEPCPGDEWAVAEVMSS